MTVRPELSVTVVEARVKPDPLPPPTFWSELARVFRVHHRSAGWADRDRWEPRLTVRPRMRSDGVLEDRSVLNTIATRDVRKAARERVHGTIWACFIVVLGVAAITAKVLWY